MNDQLETWAETYLDWWEEQFLSLLCDPSFLKASADLLPLDRSHDSSL